MSSRIIAGEENLKMKLLSRAVLWSNGRFKSDTAILVYLGLAKLIIHLLTANNYGYSCDEFYWLAMSNHLDFGYVDVTPLVAYLGAGWRFLFGASLFAIQILPALAGAVMVFFSGLLARGMGGGRFAQGFTALMVLAAPCWLITDSGFAYDPFDQLTSVILFYLLIRLIKNETPRQDAKGEGASQQVATRQWIGLGIVAGLGIMTKITMIFTVGALILAILTSPGRKSFLTKWPWLAALIASLLCTPYIIWQWVHGWPLITYWQGYQAHRPNPSGLLQFFWRMLVALNPVLLPACLLGLFYLFFHPKGKKYRPLGLCFLVLLAFYGYQKLDPHLLVSACLPLLAAGAVWLEKLNYNRLKAGGFLVGRRPTEERRACAQEAKPEATIKQKLSTEMPMSTAVEGLNPVVETISIGKAPFFRAPGPGEGTFRLTPWFVRVYLGVILISGALLVPLALPLLPGGALEKYVAATPGFIMEPLTLNNQRTKLPSHLASRLGWSELVEKVAGVYDRLPEAERKQCAIWTELYPHAGAIDLLGKKYGLPDAISTHLSYYFWGPDPNRTGVDPKVVIVLSFTSRIPYTAFDEVTRADFMIDNPLALPLVRDLSVYVCRKPKRPLKEIWPSLVSYY